MTRPIIYALAHSPPRLHAHSLSSLMLVWRLLVCWFARSLTRSWESANLRTNLASIQSSSSHRGLVFGSFQTNGQLWSAKGAITLRKRCSNGAQLQITLQVCFLVRFPTCFRKKGTHYPRQGPGDIEWSTPLPACSISI